MQSYNTACDNCFLRDQEIQVDALNDLTGHTQCINYQEKNILT